RADHPQAFRPRLRALESHFPEHQHGAASGCVGGAQATAARLRLASAKVDRSRPRAAIRGDGGADPLPRGERQQAGAALPRAERVVASAGLPSPGPSGAPLARFFRPPDADGLAPTPAALSRLGESGARALAPLLDSPNSDPRYFALLAAGSLPYPDLVDGVLRGLFDHEPDIS